MMDDNRCVVDTNLLIYGTVSSSPWHKEAKHWLASLVSKGTELCITPQVVREYLVVLTRGNIFEHQFTPAEAIGELETILPTFTLCEEKEETVSHLRSLVRRYEVRGKSIHDANVVATMVTYGIKRLVTYNTRDFRRYNEIELEPIWSNHMNEE